MINPLIPTKILEAMIKDRTLRRKITRESHKIFFHLYFSHYIKYPTALFQYEMLDLSEDETKGNLFIVAFRGSSKSTILTTSYPIWAILGKQQKKFVLVLCQTMAQAKQHMMNLRSELESNNLLKADLGPFKEVADEWGSSSLVFSQLGARISVASSEQSIRGLRHQQYRPDLIIGDDLEDIASVKTYENRKKTYEWFSGEVVPAGSLNTRIIVVGNLLHEDSLVMHLRRDIDEGKRNGIYRAYPLINENGKILWPGKYPDQEAIEEEKRRSGNEFTWQREYLLRIIPDEEQVIHPEQIQYYDEIPKRESAYQGIFTGVDLAISQKETADYTALVSALFYNDENGFVVYILPNPINRRMNFPDTIAQIKEVDAANRAIYSSHLLIENIGYQQAAIDQLMNDGLDVEGVKTIFDKRSRLATVSSLIESGKIKFPKHGAEDLIRQLVGFGVERHDDLVDAFTILAHQAIQWDKPLKNTIVFTGLHKDSSNDEDDDWPLEGFDRFERGEF